MKVRFAVAVMAALLLTSASAGAKNSRPFFLRTTAVINGAEIPSGIYELSWQPENSGVRVTLSKDGQFIATAKGAWVKHGVKYPGDAALLRVNSDGTRSLLEIRLAGVKKTIVLDNSDSVLQVGAR